MVHQKNIKTKAYFKRYQVKYRRRRAGKTDYRARLRLITQDKNKYNTPKYRLVVRFTNKDIVCQIVYATLAGDIVVSTAYAHELPRYGIKVGLTNWSAAYATGLLLARRTLKKFSLDSVYEGNTEPDGSDYNVEPVEDGPGPFTALLDVGLKRTTTGAKVFGAMKGAVDGGLNIPHNEKRFPGFDKDEKKLDTDLLRSYIYGGHVSEYMTMLEEEEPEKYNTLFARYIEEELDADSLEDMYKEAHEKIREDPEPEKKEREKPSEKTRWHAVKLTYEERKAALKERIDALKEDGDALEEEDDD